MGDGILFYSSKEKFGFNKSYQKFTAIGNVEKGEIYQTTMNPDFKPYRRDVNFMNCKEANIHPFLEKLHFVDNVKKWGYKLMNGFLEIDQHDFKLISSKMLANN